MQFLIPTVQNLGECGLYVHKFIAKFEKFFSLLLREEKSILFKRMVVLIQQTLLNRIFGLACFRPFLDDSIEIRTGHNGKTEALGLFETVLCSFLQFFIFQNVTVEIERTDLICKKRKS